MKTQKQGKSLFHVDFSIDMITKVTRIAMLFLVFISAFSFSSHATHYRYGNMSWSRVNDVTRTVTITVNQSWRRSYPLWPGANPGDIINPGTLEFGDGSSTPINLLVTSINTTEDWLFGTYTVTHTYPGVATNFTISYEGCCRLDGSAGSQNNNNGNASNFSSESLVKLISGNLGSPVSTLPPIINLAVGNSAASFIIPVSDPDATGMTFALATAAQAAGGLAYTQPAGLSVNPSTGVVTFNTVGKTIGHLYNSAIVITDASGSTSMVDFFIKIVNTSSPPYYDYSVTPANGQIFSVNPGSLLTFNVKAQDNDLGDIVTLSAVGLQPGMTFSPALPASGNPVNTSFSWTPSTLGIYIVNFTAQDIVGVQAQTSVTINVNTNPIFIAPTPTEGSTRFVEPGNTVSDVIVATNPDPMVTTQILSATLPAGASLTNALPTGFSAFPTTTMNWTPTSANWGPNSFIFSAEDINGKTATRSYDILVNALPTFTSTPITNAIVGQLYSYTVVANDPDVPYGDDLDIHLFMTVLPSWLNYDPLTHILSGTPSLSDIGTTGTIKFIAEDHYHSLHPDVLQSFAIDVIGVPPTVDCPMNINVNAATNQCSNTVSYSAAATGIPTPVVTYSPPSGNVFTVGSHVVTVTASNGVGQDAVCTFTVTVVDNQPPTALCKNYTLNLSGGTGTLMPSNIDNGSSDNCGAITKTLSKYTFNCADAGLNNVVLTVTDGAGQSSSCTAQVLVKSKPVCSISVVQPGTVYTGGIPTNIYLGYGAQSATLNASATGGNSYSYAWAPATNLSCTTCASPVFTATAAGLYTYTVTITNNYGCSTQCTVSMCVKNAVATGSGNKGKVLLCHVPPGNPGNPQTLSISPSAVPAHLTMHAGDALGACGSVCGSSNREDLSGDLYTSENGEMEIIIYPNPSASSFNITLESQFEDVYQLDIYDIVGKKVMEVHDLVPNTTHTIQNHLSVGCYNLLINQNGNTQSVRLIKKE